MLRGSAIFFFFRRVRFGVDVVQYWCLAPAYLVIEVDMWPFDVFHFRLMVLGVVQRWHRRKKLNAIYWQYSSYYNGRYRFMTHKSTYYSSSNKYGGVPTLNDESLVLDPKCYMSQKPGIRLSRLQGMIVCNLLSLFIQQPSVYP